MTTGVGTVPRVMWSGIRLGFGWLLGFLLLGVLLLLFLGISIPMAILRGAQAGQLAGSEVNEREYFKQISGCQSRYELYIMDLID